MFRNKPDRASSSVTSSSQTHQLNVNSTSQAITIQKHIRGFLARKKYALHPLQEAQKKDYPVFVVGNDPVMPDELAQYQEPHNQIALIATSGMRVVSIACQLSNARQAPKIILVDNSKQVCEFLRKIRYFITMEASTESLFF